MPTVVEILSFRHAGVRCAVPSAQVLAIRRGGDPASTLALWESVGAPESSELPRVLQVMTPAGPVEIEAGDPILSRVESSRVFALPALLRTWLILPYVVGIADLQDEMVWLVDARRLSASQRGAAPAPDLLRTAVSETEGEAP